ncbi:MAG: NAD-dependent epimerase/dehydratase family protein [Pseudomonadota bacterium]|jgi:nucleoside-diphosphate-sugar epimerase|nr:SDR family oxidoreductase [Alphaproteobacteria bacterium]
MSIVIIGNGFIGRAISQTMLENRYKHICFNSEQFNLCDPNTWKIFPDNIEQVIFAAGKICEDIEQLRIVNEDPVSMLCDFLNSKNVKKIIALSSGAVYGEYDQDRYVGLKCLPKTNYGVSKLNQENLFIAKWKKDLNILRLFFSYGPGQEVPRLVPGLLYKIKHEMPIKLNSNGGPILSLSHVKDIAECILQDFLCNNNSKAIHNLSSSYKVSIYDLSKKLAKFLGKEPFFQQADQKSNNCTSVAYAFNWHRSGKFKDVFQ